MIGRVSVIMLLCVICLSASVYAANDPEVTSGGDYLKQLQSWEKGDKPHDKLAPQNDWEKGLKSEALRYGIQGGAYWAGLKINEQLQRRAPVLDQGFDFSKLAIHKRDYVIIPPVVTEDAGRVQLGDNSRVLRVLKKTFYIERPPRLAISSPNWRSYLYVPTDKPTEPQEGLRPKSEREKQLWADAVREGWDVGVKTAYYTMRTRLARLVTDYQGMQRYVLLRKYNIISEPQVDESYLPVSGNGRQLNIEDSTVRLNLNPQLQANRFKWQPLPALPDVSWLFPSGIYSDGPRLTPRTDGHVGGVNE